MVLGHDTVAAVLDNLDTAPVGEPLRATLRLLRKVTLDHASVSPGDMRHLLDLGVTREQIEDALGVCFAFNVITRLADTFEFDIPPQSGFDVSAKRLLSRGYGA